MGKLFMKAMMEANKTAITSTSKKDMLEILAPQEIKDELVYNFRGAVIGRLEGSEDQVLNEDDVVQAITKVTSASVERVFKPLMDLMVDVTTTEDDVEDDNSPSDLDIEEELPETPEATEDDVAEEESEQDELVSKIKKLIKKGKGKKAMKLIGDVEDAKLAKKLTKKAEEL